MYVADQVQQPNQVVGLEQVRLAGSKRLPEYRNLLRCRRTFDRRQRGAVLTEWCIDEVPVLMQLLVAVTYIQ